MPRIKKIVARLLRVEGDPINGVRDLRIAVKILRAGVRFFDPKLERYQKVDRLLRSKAQKLGVLRDAEARAEILAWLEEQGIDIKVPRIIESPITSKKVVKIVLALAGECHKLLARLQKEKGGALESAKRKFSRAIASYQLEATNDNLHSMRKRAKTLRNQIHYFVSPNKGRLASFEASLSEITAELGRVRDLQLLLIELREQEASKDQIQRLEQLEDQLTKKTVVAILKLKIE